MKGRHGDSIACISIEPAGEMQLSAASTACTDRHRKMLILERDFDLRAGFTKRHGCLPRFLSTDPLSPHNLAFVIQDQYLDRVFDWHPVNPSRGFPLEVPAGRKLPAGMPSFPSG